MPNYPDDTIRIYDALEGARKRPSLYGMTREQVDSMTDAEIEKYVEDHFPQDPPPADD